MRKLLFVLSVLLFLVSSAFSQNSINKFGVIRGIVITSDGKPAALGPMLHCCVNALAGSNNGSQVGEGDSRRYQLKHIVGRDINFHADAYDV